MLKPNLLLHRLRGNDFLRHNAVFFFGGLGVGVLNYLYYPILGHLMSAEDFGELQAMVSLFLQFSIFLAALSLVTVNIVANQPDEAAKNKVVFELEKLALVVTSAMLLLTVAASPLLQSFLQFHSLLPFIALAAGFIVSVPFAFRNAYLRGKLDFLGSSIGNVIGSVAKIIFSALLVYLGLRTFGAVAGIVAAQLLAFAYMAGRAGRAGFASSAGKRWLAMPDLGVLRPQLKYGLFIFIISLIVIVQLSLDIIVVKHYFSPAEAGQYAGIASMARIIFFLTASIAMVLFSSVRLNQERRANRQLLLRSLGLFVLVGGSTLVAFGFFPGLVLGILFPKYLDFAGLLPRLSLAVFMISAANLMSSYYMALRQYWIVMPVILGAFITYGLVLLNHASVQEVVNSLLYGSIAMAGLLGAGIIRYNMAAGTGEGADA